MKIFFTFLLLLTALSSLFSQEFIKDSKVNFIDKSVIKGDFYYYASMLNTIVLVDSTGKKHNYLISDIDFIESKTSIVRNMNYKGESKLFESIVEGEKLSLYKTNINDNQELFVRKGDQLFWLECGKKEVTIDSKTYFQEIVTYKGILKVLLNDNPTISKEVDQISCSEKEISDIIIAYNEGHISYFKNKDIENLNRQSDWRIYSNYSKYKGNPNFLNKFPIGSFVQIGTEYFRSEGSRHSLKCGIEYGKFEMRTYNVYSDNMYYTTYKKYLNLNLSYYYDLFRSPIGKFYLGVRIVDIGKLWDAKESELIIAPRLSPGFGFKVHINKQVDVFGEINHILMLDNIPANFSMGISCDI